MAKKKNNQPARLQEALVLHKYILKLFGCNDLEGLSRDLKGLQDPKIQLYNQLKTEVEPSLNDADIILDSYIISNTDYNQVKFWGGKEELSKTDFENEHVLFQNDSNYIKVLFERVMTEE